MFCLSIKPDSVILRLLRTVSERKKKFIVQVNVREAEHSSDSRTNHDPHGRFGQSPRGRISQNTGNIKFSYRAIVFDQVIKSSPKITQSGMFQRLILSIFYFFPAIAWIESRCFSSTGKVTDAKDLIVESEQLSAHFLNSAISFL